MGTTDRLDGFAGAGPLTLRAATASAGWGLRAYRGHREIALRRAVGASTRTLFVAALLEGAVAAAPALVGGLIAGLAGAQLGRAGPHRRRYSRAREPERMFIRTLSQPENPFR